METLSYTTRWDTETWTVMWRCLYPGCHELNAGYKSPKSAEVAAQHHFESHASRRGW
jgi:hypothetical protein